VLYKPCQKIGGDFFWISRHEKALVLGVIDCTGHGVPGALISMASFDLLKRIINESNCHDPAEILSQLNTEFISLFDPTANKLHDGLDIALVSMNEVDGRLLFAGAGNGLYFSDGQSIQEIKGRREGIGGYEYTQKAEFENVEIPYNAELTYYLYSDGLSDQFGGPQNKKMGRQRLKEFLIKLEGETMERRLRKVQTFFAEWKGENEQIDDVTLIGFKVKEL
jgi:serine phosphatase RsbU (regulator of sigma subunit)